MRAFAVSWIPIIKRWEAGNYEILQPTLANPISAVALVVLQLITAATTKGTSLSFLDSVVLYVRRARVAHSIYLRATHKHLFIWPVYHVSWCSLLTNLAALRWCQSLRWPEHLLECRTGRVWQPSKKLAAWEATMPPER